MKKTEHIVETKCGRCNFVTGTTKVFASSDKVEVVPFDLVCGKCGSSSVHALIPAELMTKRAN